MKLLLKSEAIENHHPNKIEQPSFTVSILRKEHQKLHGLEVNDTPLSRKMRQYDKTNTLLVTIKNWSISYQKDFGIVPDVGIEHVTKLKAKFAIELRELVQAELPKVKHIKGFGPRYLAGILAYAHPARFSSLRKFLFYCGFTQASKEKKTYCRRIKPLMYNLVCQIIKARDTKYYSLYLKLKEDVKVKFQNKPKIAIHKIAINRPLLSTYLLF